MRTAWVIAALLVAAAVPALAAAPPLPRVTLTITCSPDCREIRLNVVATGCAADPGELALAYVVTFPHWDASASMDRTSLAPTGDPACPYRGVLAGSVAPTIVQFNVCVAASATIAAVGADTAADHGCYVIV